MDLLNSIAIERLEVVVEISELQEKLDALYERLSRLDKAEAALNGKSLTAFKGAKPKPPTPQTNLTIKQMVLIILKENPEGLTALDILSTINAHFNQSFARTSLSPQLSRLKGLNKIHKVNKHWVLSELKETPM